MTLLLTKDKRSSFFYCRNKTCHLLCVFQGYNNCDCSDTFMWQEISDTDLIRQWYLPLRALHLFKDSWTLLSGFAPKQKSSRHNWHTWEELLSIRKECCIYVNKSDVVKNNVNTLKIVHKDLLSKLLLIEQISWFYNPLLSVSERSRAW